MERGSCLVCRLRKVEAEWSMYTVQVAAELSVGETCVGLVCCLAAPLHSGFIQEVSLVAVEKFLKNIFLARTPLLRARFSLLAIHSSSTEFRYLTLESFSKIVHNILGYFFF